MALMANSYHTSSDIPFWVQLSCAIAMGLGTSVGGWKIIKTVGGQIMKIRPVNGVAADLSSSLVIFGATFIHLPVSTTHVISSSILGGWCFSSCKRCKMGNCKTHVDYLGYYTSYFSFISCFILFFITLNLLIKSRLPYFSRKTTFLGTKLFLMKKRV